MLNNSTDFALAFVTGASSGIGEGICRLLAQKGISLIITGRNHENLQKLARELQEFVSVEIVIADIGTKEDCIRLVNKIHERAPDLVINNAGFGVYGKALTQETDKLKAIIDVNVSGVLELTLEASRALLAAGKKGVILNVSSSADMIVMPGLAVYAASKAFVTQFSKSLDEEMRPLGVRVLVSCPGVVATEFRRRASGVANAEQDKFSMTIPFAVNQIWKQIVKRKQVHYFDWKTHVAAFLARFVVPQKIVSKFLLHTINNYLPTREIITKNTFK